MTKARWLQEIYNSGADVEDGTLLSYGIDWGIVTGGSRRIGLTIPPNVLVRADKVIK